VWWKPGNTLVNTGLINLEAKFDELSHFEHSDEATKYEQTGCYPRNISICVVFRIHQGTHTKRSWAFYIVRFWNMCFVDVNLRATKTDKCPHLKVRAHKTFLLFRLHCQFLRLCCVKWKDWWLILKKLKGKRSGQIELYESVWLDGLRKNTKNLWVAYISDCIRTGHSPPLRIGVRRHHYTYCSIIFTYRNLEIADR